MRGFHCDAYRRSGMGRRERTATLIIWFVISIKMCRKRRRDREDVLVELTFGELESGSYQAPYNGCRCEYLVDKNKPRVLRCEPRKGDFTYLCTCACKSRPKPGTTVSSLGTILRLRSWEVQRGRRERNVQFHLFRFTQMSIGEGGRSILSPLRDWGE